MVLVNPSVPYAKEFLRKLFAIWAFALRNICFPCYRPKIFKEYWFEAALYFYFVRGAKSMASPGRPHVSGRLCLYIWLVFTWVLHVSTPELPVMG
jgi:hypothetical protein